MKGVPVFDERIRSFLIDREIITDYQWIDAVNKAAGAKNPLAILTQENLVLPAQAYGAYAYSRGWVYVDVLELGDIPSAIIDLMDAASARNLNVLPVRLNKAGDLVVACSQPDLNKSKEIRGIVGQTVELVYAPEKDLRTVVGQYYSTSAEAMKMGRAAAASVGVRVAEVEVDPESQIVSTLNVILEGALREGASDIHLEPAAGVLTVRYSIDGQLRTEPNQPSNIGPRIASLIKTRAKLTSSSLISQSGAFSHVYNGRSYDIRVAVMPTHYGESITMRMGADKIRKLTEVGFSPKAESEWRRALTQPNGIMLSVGPMGSGKTTLSYASLGEFLGEGRKIVSLENPVELKIPHGITQVSINEAQGMTWETAMGDVLRMAASVLFVGEINRREIAHTAVEAALTGHLVLSTLHTNDAPGAVVRLREMGLRPSVLADAMRTVCAQRLPARLCPDCKVPTKPSDDLARDFELSTEDIAGIEWFAPSGKDCKTCRNTGYKGRLPIHELMTFPREIRELIQDDAPGSVITTAARNNGMVTLKEDGLDKARQGLTSLAEVRRHILID